jgi:hypothetical protein
MDIDCPWPIVHGTNKTRDFLHLTFIQKQVLGDSEEILSWNMGSPFLKISTLTWVVGS